ncbi:MAG: hypothetical protein ACRD0K_28380 [Egibacteraceae bacterium]
MSTAQRPPARTSTAAALSLALGLLALALSWLPVVGIFAFPLGFLAVAAALWGLRAVRRFKMAGRGLLIAGLVTGVLSLLFALNYLRIFVGSLRDPELVERVEQFLNRDSG